jgi:hypothetical protein
LSGISVFFCSSESIAIKVAPAGVGAVVEVSTNSKETAMPLLPDGASRWDLRTLQVFRDYTFKE